MSGLPKQPLLLRIEKPAYGGAGLARDDGKVVFTPYTLPGELVTSTVTHSKSSFAEASLAEVIEPSPDRVHPPCTYFGVCGGCHYQHAGYPAQLRMKAAILEETLLRARLTDLPAIVTHASGPFGYRNRIRLQLDPVSSALCYRERGAHRLIEVRRCPIAAPDLERALISLAEVCVSHQCGSFFSQVELSVNHDGSELLMALSLRGDANAAEAGVRLERLCSVLAPRLPALRGAGVQRSTEAVLTVGPRSRSATRQLARRGGRPASQSRTTGAGQDSGADESTSAGALLASWGTPQMTYQVAGVDYRVSLGAFFQVNRGLAGTLVELATRGRSGVLAWDLYAGVGLFSRVLATRFEQVVAVEASPVACGDLRENLGPPHQAICRSTLEFLRRQTLPRMGKPGRFSPLPKAALPDFVLVDPPRAGLGEEAAQLLSQIGPSEITYVSCDPATLSRDLRVLVNSGYKLNQIHLIDLFPQTFHLETVAMLSRT